MKSKIVIAFLVAACYFGSSLAACSQKANDTAESWICENIVDLTALGIVPATAQKITIFNSRLPSLPANAFSRFSGSLVYLNISHSEVSDILPGTFAGLIGLRDLILDHNHIKLIKANWIKDLSNLRSLRIWHNDINLIEPAVFEHLPNLELLDIADNKIDDCLKIESLTKLKNLQVLYIADNPWPLRCRPPVIFHLEHQHVQVINTWRSNHILIAECLAHDPLASYNDESLRQCVNKLGTKPVDTLSTDSDEDD